MTAPATAAEASGTLYGCRMPRLFTREARPLTPETSRGFECIRFAHDVLGVELMPWQQEFLIRALELRRDGSYRFRRVLLLVGRQNGKTLVVKVLILWRMYLEGAKLVLGTAQSLDIAEDTWQEIVDEVEANPWLAPTVVKVNNIAGKKTLEVNQDERKRGKFKQRYKAAAATRKAGRSLSADLVFLDELREHTNYDTYGAVTKTTNAVGCSQILCASNAGDRYSIVLKDLRDKALEVMDNADEDNRLCILEWSAEPGCSIWDRNAWAQANPALGYVQHEDVIASDAAADPEEVFRTEVLCQWVTVKITGPFPRGKWESRVDRRSQIADTSDIWLGVHTAADRSSTWISVAGWKADKITGEQITTIHVEGIVRRAGLAWAHDFIIDIFKGDDNPVVAAWRDRCRGVIIQTRGTPSSELVEDLQTAGVHVETCGGSDLGVSFGMFYDAVRDGTLSHLGQHPVDLAAETAQTKAFGEGRIIDGTKSAVDTAGLQAQIFAAWGLREADPPPPPDESVYNQRGMVIF